MAKPVGLVISLWYGRMIPWLIICLSVFLIGLTKSGLGAGMGLIVVPMTAIALGHTPMGAEAALGLLLPLLILGDLIAVAQYRRIYDFSYIRPLLWPTGIGIGIGSLLLLTIHQQSAHLVGVLMRLEIGLESIFLVSLHWWRTYKGIQQRLMSEPSRSWVTGLFIGISTTLAHAAGPIMAAYLLPLRLERRVFVGTTAVFFLSGQLEQDPVLLWGRTIRRGQLETGRDACAPGVSRRRMRVCSDPETDRSKFFSVCLCRGFCHGNLPGD
ncbi:MAG: hypothetical protein KatS3mg104_1103 [Phycisphaerae bacterium]|nr:MAG: hypothetical protein KatS3mg104_1103 [Phycisphaerae bacterium]